jgi:predicted dithiol-disulfide oxidoreductase (DUF899 family)
LADTRHDDQATGWSVEIAEGHLKAARNQAARLSLVFGLSVFLRDGEQVYRTYFTQARGVDRLRADHNLLDLTAYGRQEQLEDSPPGWPQDPTMSWMRHHDEYTDQHRTHR